MALISLTLLRSVHAVRCALAMACLSPLAGAQVAEPTSAREGEDDDSREPILVTVEGQRPHPAAAPKARYVAGWVAAQPRLEVAGVQTADVLRESPGVQVTQLGGIGAPATASIRGATAAQTPVYLAGIRLNDEVGGAANLADVPLFLIDRIEVYRSHAPLMADRMGIGGAVFVEPKRPTESELGMGTMGGSYGAHAGWLYVGEGGDAGAVLAGIQAYGAANDYRFDNDGGTLFVRRDDHNERLRNADVSGYDGWLSARRAVGIGSITLVANHTDRDQGTPKLATVPANRARIAFQRRVVGLRAVSPVFWGRRYGTIEARTSLATSATRIDDPLHELDLLGSGSETTGVRLEQMVGARQHFGPLSLVEQAAIAVERLQRFRTDAPDDGPVLSARRGFMRSVLSAELALAEHLYVDATGAVECDATAAGEPVLCEQAFPTGRVGTSFRTPSVELYANLGRYHRLPTLGELYGASTLVRGNPTLDPEYGLSGEIGGRWQREGSAERPLLWVDVSAFGRRTAALVTYVRTAQGFLYPVNRDRARALGAEAMAGTSPAKWVEGEVTLSAIDPRDTSPSRETVNDVLPYVSRLVGSVRISLKADFERAGLDGVRATFLGIHQSSSYADPAGLGVIPAQSTIDLELDARWFERRLRVALRGANVLDAQRFDVVGFPLPGRSVFFLVEAKL